MGWDPLTAEQRQLRQHVRELARARIAPRAAEIDASHEFPWDVVEWYREHEIFGLFFEEADGGLGTGTLLSLVAIEEVSKVCATSGLILAVQELGSLGLKLGGSEEQRARWLPRLASGEILAAYALTEAGAGSDAAALRTSAVRDGDSYVLDGSKRFITNAGVAGLYTVFAKTDPAAGHVGISAFLVEADTPGFEVTRLELDEAAILSAARKSGKVLIAHSATKLVGVGAEVAALISEQAFEWLDAPIVRLGGLDVPVPFSPPLEDAYRPNAEKIYKAALELARF